MGKGLASNAIAMAQLNARVVNCERCPRLRAYCAEVARVKRRAYLDQEYWGRPVPSFGDPMARVLILGLAPGAHGSNRTGRPFTGDGSGSFLYPVLHEAGFASQPIATSRDDGMTLHDAQITAVVRCAPPGNKPMPIEIVNCSSYLDEEIAALTRLRVVVCLGKIAFDGYVAHLIRAGAITRRGNLNFSHGAEFAVPEGRHLLATYHPSLQNTNTGKLTAAMFLKVFQRARALASKDAQSRPVPG
jgi:uracil-DNA glycosylase family 4